VLAYDTCLARHPRDAALCEGPRRAYELEPSTLQASAVGTDPPSDSSYEGRAALTRPVITPVVPPTAIGSGQSE
jgi:hypothetical protein